jgi:hypothetical protein
MAWSRCILIFADRQTAQSGLARRPLDSAHAVQIGGGLEVSEPAHRELGEGQLSCPKLRVRAAAFGPREQLHDHGFSRREMPCVP